MWRYCIPLLGSVIFQQLYNIADSLVAGKYVGKNALAAVGNSYEITLIYMAFAFGCNMGCSVIAAQFFGAKNYRKMKTTVYTTFIYSAVLCLILTLTGLFAGGPGMKRILSSPDGTRLLLLCAEADSVLLLDAGCGLPLVLARAGLNPQNIALDETGDVLADAAGERGEELLMSARSLTLLRRLSMPGMVFEVTLCGGTVHAL